GIPRRDGATAELRRCALRRSATCSASFLFRLGMAAVAAHDDAPDDDEHADGQQEVQPSRSAVDERADGPHDDERDTGNDSDIHELTVRGLDLKLPSYEIGASTRDGELRF